MSRTVNSYRPSIGCCKPCNNKRQPVRLPFKEQIFSCFLPSRAGFLTFPFVKFRRCPAQTISFRPFNGSTLTTFRAGLALNTMASPVNGLTPLRDLVAGLRTTLIFIRPGNVYIPGPVRLMSRLIRVLRDSKTALTSFLVRPVLSAI